ncbi:hypothetical protein GCM10010441_69680 [Kitasatospora paracochleata]|uniref:Condensation domain-containing protein n=1 Tax=Kitasatospora paracochleata TaxID=58354 RepID=A0ABT1JBA7_9ACTN|nr:condensation domain-containing protein [Kitasatospora paracochleata]MCP2314371.1 hypothetical protein [Kitasatospora paracochleata]
MIRRNSAPATDGEPTVGQEALWLLQNLAPDCAAYNVTAALRLHFPVDADLLEAAVRATASGHRLLDAVFACDPDGRLRRRPGNAATAPGLFERHEPGLDDGPELRAYALELTRRPFRLDREPPIRAALLRPRTGPDILLAQAHHIVADNISQLLICQEILSHYAALADGRRHPTRDDGAAFDAFARRAREHLASPRAERSGTYWRRELAGLTEHTALPADLPRPPHYRYQGAELDVELEPELTADLAEAVASRNVTTFAYLLAVFALLLHRHGGQQDFLVGYPVTQRRGEELREAVGYFVNTLPLRVRIGPEDSFDTLLDTVAAGLWRALLHREHPFALLSRQTDLPRDPARPGPLPALFVFNEPAEDDPLAAALEPGRRIEYAGLTAEEYYLPQQQGQFELTLQVTRRSATTRATLKYNTSLFSPHAAARLAEDYRALLRAAVGNTLPPTCADLRK